MVIAVCGFGILLLIAGLPLLAGMATACVDEMEDANG